VAGIAARVAHDFRRRSARETLQRFPDALQVSEGLDAEAHLTRVWSRELVVRVLGALPARHRETLILHDIDGRSTRELADHWSVPVFTVYTRIRRARQAFAKELRRQEATSAKGAPSGRR
jgi:DNA-directed RNA polymerase specialized sigma24 family protein